MVVSMNQPDDCLKVRNIGYGNITSQRSRQTLCLSARYAAAVNHRVMSKAWRPLLSPRNRDKYGHENRSGDQGAACAWRTARRALETQTIDVFNDVAKAKVLSIV